MLVDENFPDNSRATVTPENTSREGEKMTKGKKKHQGKAQGAPANQKTKTKSGGKGRRGGKI